MESVLKPRKALKLLAPDYPINAYYRAVKEEQSPKKPRKKKSYLIIFRHEDSVWRMDLEKNEYYALERLFSGKPIGVVLESLPAELGVAEEELSTELMQWFGRWIRNGILAADEVAAAPKIKNAV